MFLVTMLERDKRKIIKITVKNILAKRIYDSNCCNSKHFKISENSRNSKNENARNLYYMSLHDKQN